MTYIPVTGGAILTSNRDEHRDRPAAELPRPYGSKGDRLYYPRDPQAGGTWFAVDGNGAVGIVLNGAFEGHDRKPPYRRSRGLVLLDAMGSGDPSTVLDASSLMGIEPFTLVHTVPGEWLHVYRWDDSRLHRESHDPLQPWIWSSATLYDKEARSLRERWFHAFLERNSRPDGAAVMDFHGDDHGDRINGFVIDRSNGVRTRSITQARVGKDRVALHHFDPWRSLRGELEIPRVAGPVAKPV